MPKYVKYVSMKCICKICTPHFDDVSRTACSLKHDSVITLLPLLPLAGGQLCGNLNMALRSHKGKSPSIVSKSLMSHDKNLNAVPSPQAVHMILRSTAAHCLISISGVFYASDSDEYR